jgi:hypothetical protein
MHPIVTMGPTGKNFKKKNPSSSNVFNLPKDNPIYIYCDKTSPTPTIMKIMMSILSLTSKNAKDCFLLIK